MREHHPEQNERATARTANAVEPSVNHSNQMLPIPRAFDGVDHLRMKAALETLAHQAGPEATGMKRVSNRLKKDDDEEEAILLAQAPADTSNHNNAPPSEKAISVVSEAAFNPECTATTADGCGVAVGAAGKSVGIAPWLFLPLLALGGGGSSEPPPTLKLFTEDPELFDGDSSKKVNVSKNEFELEFETDKDLTGKVRYELSSSTDAQNKHGATIDPKNGVIKFNSFDQFCIGDELQFTVKAVYEDGSKKAASTYTFSLKVIGPKDFIVVEAADLTIGESHNTGGPADFGRDNLDALLINDTFISGNEMSRVNTIYFGTDDNGVLCIRIPSKDGHIEFSTSDIDYVFFGSKLQYNYGDPDNHTYEIFGHDVSNKIYKLNHPESSLADSLTIGDKEADCDQLLYGVLASSEIGMPDTTTITGGSGDDLIFGSQLGGNFLDGGDGDDVIFFIAPTNEIRGGKGSDTLIALGSDPEKEPNPEKEPKIDSPDLRQKNTFIYHLDDIDANHKDTIYAWHTNDAGRSRDVFIIDGVQHDYKGGQWTSKSNDSHISIEGRDYWWTTDSSAVHFATANFIA